MITIVSTTNRENNASQSQSKIESIPLSHKPKNHSEARGENKLDCELSICDN